MKPAALIKFIVFVFIFSIKTAPVSGQNVWIQGKTTDYYSGKKVKGVQIKVLRNDSLIEEYKNQNKIKIHIQERGVIKVLFEKTGYISKYFLINTKAIPSYYADKKFKVKADVSLAVEDKYMEDNSLENAVGYLYFNKKYKGFIWDPEYTKKAQIAMDAQIFPLEEVVELDEKLNPRKSSYFFQKGINFYANISYKPEQLFIESLDLQSKSPIKSPLIQGYLYGKMTYFILTDDLNGVNTCAKNLNQEQKEYTSIVEAFKDCKRLDTLVLNNKYAAIGYWLNLVNYCDTNDLKHFIQIVSTIEQIQKHFVSIEMTDAELSFYSDFRNALKSGERFKQKINYLRPSELEDPSSYTKELGDFKQQISKLAENSGLSRN